MEPFSELFNIVQIPLGPSPHDAPEYTEGIETLSLCDLQPHELCDYCQSIPFDSLGLHGKIFMTELDDPFLRLRERPLQQIFKNLHNCFFCQKTALIFQRFNRDKCGNLPLSQLGNIEVGILPVWHHSIEKDENGRSKGCLLRLGVKFCLWNFTPEGGNYSPIFVFQRFNEPSLTTGISCKDENDEDWAIETTEPYCGRIRPLLADLCIFRKWMDICLRNHGDHCDTSFTGPHLDRLRLIDVEEMRIVQTHGDQDYVALSYVWGTAEMLKLLKGNFDYFQTSGSLKSATLPTTIADAIEVTRGIGEKYLWVDALCIIQDDENDKAYFIPNMDSVYGCGLVTIIALSGENANAGLPGIRPDSRIQEELPFTIGKTPIIASLDPPKEQPFSSYLGHSRWDSRGWTFQEKIFSRRALVFTPEQAYWECQEGSWCEDANWEILNSPHIFRGAFKRAGVHLPWSEDQASAESTYRALVEQYSARKLSFETDALNAFAGLLHAMERTWRQEYFWGLPRSFLSSALQWKIDLGNKAERRVASVPYKTSEGITRSLQIPSWSWVGWNSGISMANFDSRGMAIEVRFYLMTNSGKLEEIIEGEQPIRSEVDTLRKKWKTMNTAVDVADLPSGVLDHPLRWTFLCFWSSSANLSYVWLPDFMGNLRLIIQGLRFAWMQRPNLEPVIQKGIEELIAPDAENPSTGCGEFVVIGRDMHTHVGGCGDMLTLILIERKGDIVYRRGLLSVAEEDWALVNSDWKLFVLG